MNEKIRYTLTLLILGAISSGALAGIYAITKDRIDESNNKKKTGALTKMAEFLGKKFEISAKPKTFIPEGDGKQEPVEFFEVREEGKKELLGYGIISGQVGYSSIVNVMVLAVPVKENGKTVFKVKLARVTQSAETPGLGERIKEEPVLYTLYDLVADPENAKKEKAKKTWPSFMERFNDKSAADIDPTNGSGIVISGATISSKAVKAAIKNALLWAEMISSGKGKIEEAK